MNKLINYFVISIFLLSTHVYAVGNPEFTPDGTTPDRGELIIDEVNVNGRVGFQDVKLDCDFTTLNCIINDSKAVDSDTIVPAMQAIEGGVKIEDTWISSGGRNTASFKNHHFLFDITQAGNVTINIRSSAGNYLYLVDSLGIIVASANGNTITANLSPDTYRLIAATYYANQASNYALTLTGAMSNIRKINSTRIERKGKWTSSGGRSLGSTRNDHYLFEVSSESYIDIAIKSTVGNYLYLVNSLGFVIASANGNRLISTVPADSYRLVVATYYPAEASNYVLTFVGQFTNLTKKTSASIKTIGSWTSSGGRDRYSSSNPSYSFDVTEESVIDVTIRSSASNYLYLVDSLNNLVMAANDNRLKASVSAGRYKLVAGTYYKGEKSNFVLTTYGQFANFVQN